MSDFDEIWLLRERDALSRRYGVGTFVAVYQGAVIEWGSDENFVRDRAEQRVRAPVFVGVVPEPIEKTDDEIGYEEYQKLAERHMRRRVEFNVERYYEVCALVGGSPVELLQGLVYVGGMERRYAEHDYRLLVEHGLVSEKPC